MARQTITRTTKNTVRISYGRDVRPSYSSANTKSNPAGTSVKAVKPSQVATRKQNTK